jgi:hypothetical protein
MRGVELYGLSNERKNKNSNGRTNLPLVRLKTHKVYCLGVLKNPAVTNRSLSTRKPFCGGLRECYFLARDTPQPHAHNPIGILRRSYCDPAKDA